MKIITVPTLPFGLLQSHIVQDTRIIIVDTGKPGSVQKILSAMKKHDISHEHVAMILLTHSHLDHAGSAAELQKVVKAPVAIHRLEREQVLNHLLILLSNSTPPLECSNYFYSP